MTATKRKRAAKARTVKGGRSKGEMPNPSHKKDFDRILNDAIGVRKE